MKLEEAKSRFIESWGTLGSSWGISRTMAQIHALLLVEPESLSTEDIMEALSISRGNVNLNVRNLMDWGLVRKELKQGERREYFSAEKDIDKVFRQVVRERRRRELEPIFDVLDEIRHLEEDPKDPKVKQFNDTVQNISSLAGMIDRVMKTVGKPDGGWLINAVMKLLR